MFTESAVAIDDCNRLNEILEANQASCRKRFGYDDMKSRTIALKRLYCSVTQRITGNTRHVQLDRITQIFLAFLDVMDRFGFKFTDVIEKSESVLAELKFLPVTAEQAENTAEVTRCESTSVSLSASSPTVELHSETVEAVVAGLQLAISYMQKADPEIETWKKQRDRDIRRLISLQGELQQ